MHSRKSKPLPTLLAIAAAAVASTGVARADGYGTLQIDSGERQVALLELYTSEGCSSCPPADRWFSKLKADRQLWSDIVPVALHVDYWNYIGWTDRFSKASHSDRQREYFRNGGARATYTPGFFSNGKEWRGWFSGDALETTRPPVGNLALGLDGYSIAVQFSPLVNIEDDLIVNVAVLGMGLESDVRAGENNGRKLQHDFVVLNIQSFDLLDSAGGYKAIAEIDDISTEAERLALAAWVSTRTNQKPIQAVGAYLQ